MLRHPGQRSSAAAADIQNVVVSLNLPKGKRPAGHIVMALIHALQHFFAILALRLSRISGLGNFRLSALCFCEMSFFEIIFFHSAAVQTTACQHFLYPLFRVACQKLFMLHRMVPDIRIHKMSSVAVFVFLPHLHGIKTVNFRSGHINIIFQRRHHIGKELVENARIGHKCHGRQLLRGGTAPEQLQHCLRILGTGFFFHFLFCPGWKLSAAKHFSKKRRHSFRHRPGSKAAALIQIGASEDSVPDMDFFALHHKSHKGAAQRTAICRKELTAEIFLDIVFQLCRLDQHVRKGRILRLVEPVIGRAEHIKVLLQQRDHMSEVPFPVTACPRQQ